MIRWSITAQISKKLSTELSVWMIDDVIWKYVAKYKLMSMLSKCRLSKIKLIKSYILIFVFFTLIRKGGLVKIITIVILLIYCQNVIENCHFYYLKLTDSVQNWKIFVISLSIFNNLINIFSIEFNWKAESIFYQSKNTI